MPRHSLSWSSRRLLLLITGVAAIALSPGTLCIHQVAASAAAVGMGPAVRVASRGTTTTTTTRAATVVCGDAHCGDGHACCGNTTCYNPAHGETCCLPSNASQFWYPQVCGLGTICCGGGETMGVACIDPLNETCCTTRNDPDVLSRSCPLSSSCCMYFGPPVMFSCCGEKSTCCATGEGADAQGACCAPETTCCKYGDASEIACCTFSEACDPENGCR